MPVDVDEKSFQAAVIDRSRALPVVVDFWAAWCGPCRTLGPLLERAVESRRGRVELVKVDTDANQGLARRYGIQSIPAVKAFRDGELVDEFVGAQPAPAVERFLDALAPSEADELVTKGDQHSLRRALEIEPGHRDAAVALARLLLAENDAAGALELVRDFESDFEAEGLATRAELVVEDSDDPDLKAALAALSDDQYEAALELLARLLVVADDVQKERVRKLMVGVFNELGADHELSRAYRRKLAASLY